MATTSTAVVVKFPTLEYYTELEDGRDGNPSQATAGVSLAQLHFARTHLSNSDFLGCWEKKALDSAIKETEELLLGDSNPSCLKNLIIMLVHRYLVTDSLDDLRTAILRVQETIISTSQEHPERPLQIADLLSLMLFKARVTSSQDDLDEATVIAEELGATESFHKQVSTMIEGHVNLPIDIFELFEIDAELSEVLNHTSDEDLDSFVNLQEGAQGDEQTEVFIYACFLHFARTGSAESLARAVHGMEDFIIAIPRNHRDYGRRSRILKLMERITRSKARSAGLPHNVDELVQLLHRIQSLPRDLGSLSVHSLCRNIEDSKTYLGIASLDDPDRGVALNNLGNLLDARFQRTNSKEDIDLAIHFARKAAAVAPDDLRLAGRLRHLGGFHGTRFERTGSSDDIDLAIRYTRAALDIDTSQDPSCRNLTLCGLGIWLSRRYERFGFIHDLNASIDATKEALDTAPEDSLERADHLHNLAMRLHSRFEKVADMDDLNSGIRLLQEAVSLSSILQNRRHEAASSSSLSILLNSRHHQTGSMADFSSALELSGKAADIVPKDSIDRPAIWNGLAILLHGQFEKTGQIGHLDKCIDTTIMAMTGLPTDHPDVRISTSNLAIWLNARALRTGSTEDVELAIDAARTALDSMPKDHPARPLNLDSLQNSLMMRYSKTLSTADLEEAVKAAEEAVLLSPPGHILQACFLNNLSRVLGDKAQRTRSLETLDSAISNAEKAIRITPEGHTDKASRLGNLGSLHHRRFALTKSVGSLNKAIDATARAASGLVAGNAGMAGYLNNLGRFFKERHDMTGSGEDARRALTSYHQSLSCDIDPVPQLSSVLEAARIYGSHLKWAESLQLLEQGLELLPALTSRALSHTDKQNQLLPLTGLAPMTAAVALNAGREPYQALQLLERGRGVIAGLVMDMWGDISRLEKEHPSWAAEFASLRQEINSPRSSLGPIHGNRFEILERKDRSRRLADQALSELTAKIRLEPGFHGFLCPPTKEELMAAAANGPVVVINLSEYRCDALLVQRDSITTLELLGLSVADVEERVRSLNTSGFLRGDILLPTLEWMWEVITRPCLDALGFSEALSAADRNWPRVWWVPTGPLCRLPLHAAGLYQSRSTNTVLDRVMSSYAPSVKALMHGRRHATARKAAETEPSRAVLVPMKTTPGLGTHRDLVYAEDEVDMVANLCGALRLEEVRPAARKAEVLGQLQECTAFHFAGHGISYSGYPSESCLVLQDWESNALTVDDLRGSHFQDNSPFLAYLSACSTGANEAFALIDEGVHLMSSLQLAGFRHVVGTLWEVSDEHCVEVARVFYETLRDEGRTDVAVCRGLHLAIKALRDRQWTSRSRSRKAFSLRPGGRPVGLQSFHWVPYIHFGV